jgi:hypothetical protein
MELETTGPGQYVTRWRNEYNYIEHAMVGALWGIARVCNVGLQLEVKMYDPFNGDLAFTPTRPAVTAMSP